MKETNVAASISPIHPLDGGKGDTSIVGCGQLAFIVPNDTVAYNYVAVLDAYAVVANDVTIDKMPTHSIHTKNIVVCYQATGGFPIQKGKTAAIVVVYESGIEKTTVDRDSGKR